MKQYERVGAEIILCDEPKKVAKKEWNVFAITDAFTMRDKKTTWLLYREAMALEHAPEEIVGVLFWAVKNMLLLASTKGAAGLSPFVADKARRGLSKWKQSELEDISRSLVEIMNEAHMGLVEIEEGIEELILKM